MPVVDMPLSQLREYQGTTPCPTDFDLYWDNALAEMQALSPDVEWIPAEFPVSFAECYHLYFTGTKGARIHAKVIRPKKILGKVPAILLFHGYAGNSGDWFPKLAFAASGCMVAALDCRGQGGLSEDRGGVKGDTFQGHVIRGVLEEDPNKLLFRNIFLDTVRLAQIILQLPCVDTSRVSACGGSQGGGLALACAALEPGISKVAVQFPFLIDYKRTWDMDLTAGALAEITSYFRRFDPEHERESDFFTRLGYIDVQNLAPRIRAKVLMATGLRDVVCPPSTQFAAYNKIQSPKKMEIYPDYGHEYFPGWEDHVFQFLMES